MALNRPLTSTCSLSVAEAGQAEVRTMLLGALGCNLAWGIIDGVFYLMGCLAEKGRALITLRAVRKATDPQAAQRLIAEALPSTVASQALQVPQCGYCQPGMIMASVALLREKPSPTAEDIETAITNICRCGTYNRVREAILAAASKGGKSGD